MNKKIGLIESRILMYIVNGTVWLAYGVLSLFDNVICTLLSAVFLLCGSVALILAMSSREKDDEMSKYNLMKAKSTAMDWLKMIILVILIINLALGLLHTIFPSINETIFISIKTVVPMIIGVSEIITGSLFLKYERDGE